MNTLRIAAAVVSAPIGEKEENLTRVTHWTKIAVERGCRLICFPEMNITGYCNKAAMAGYAEMIPGPASDRLLKLAGETGVTILAGMAEKDATGNLYIVHLAASPAGDLTVYRKLHLAPPEQTLYCPGADIPLFKVEDTTCGIQLCYDAHFPELTTRMAVGGADVIFIPHASPSRGMTVQDKHQSWMRHLPARAYDNSLFIVACNLHGENCNGLEFPGNAVILDPSGNILDKKLDDGERLLVVDLKAGILEHVREHRMRYFLPNRRPELY
ncbi:MAG: nitrilase [Desulfobacterales bacterium]|nr:nitrilase [Desulfobacterales bacterium]